MPPAVKKISICKQEVKSEKTLKPEPCGAQLVNDGGNGLRCPNRDEHILKYKTGFCANGNCEGSAKKTPSGKPHKTCDWWKRCPCDCHKAYDLLFATSGMSRQLVDNSGYSVDRGGFKMPTLAERVAAMASSRPAHVDAPTLVESPAPEVVPATLRRAFTPTATGRAARGELTFWVKMECDTWLLQEPIAKCTPVYLAEAIAKTQGFVRPPSVGAVDAVLKRWVSIGFAVIEMKPTRFVRYTEDGIELGLEGCIERAKRAKRQKESEAGRSFRR